MNLSLLEIYHKYLEFNEYKYLNTIEIDNSSILKRKFEYWSKDTEYVILEILDDNICFLYKEFIIQNE